MAERNIKKELGGIRQRIQQKKQSSKLTELFKGHGKTDKRQTEIKKINAAVRELEEDKRVLGAVMVYLDVVSEEAQRHFEAEHPKLTKLLFELADTLVKGEYGGHLQVAAQSQDAGLISWETMTSLAFIHLCRHSQELEVPWLMEEAYKTPLMAEIAALVQQLDSGSLEKIVLEKGVERGPGHKYCSRRLQELVNLLVCGPGDQKVMLHLFRKYLNNFTNPSSVAVNMMLKREDDVGRSFNTAMALKNKTERSKSLNNIVNKLFESNRVDQAIKMVGSIKAKKEMARPLKNLVRNLLNPKRKDIEQLIAGNQIDEAVEIAEALTDREQRDNVLQRIVSGLAKHDRVEKALEIAGLIKDRDTRNFALSSMVSALSAQGHFEEAISVASVIADPGFREDAHSYIVRGLIEAKSFSDVVAFLEKIKNQTERTRAAKIVLSSVLASRDSEKADRLRAQFELSR